MRSNEGTTIDLIAPTDVRDGDIILDVRKHPGSRQIRGALRYDPEAILQSDGELPIERDRRIVLDTQQRSEAEAIGAHLNDLGFTNVTVLVGGFDGWQHAGLPVEKATQER